MAGKCKGGKGSVIKKKKIRVADAKHNRGFQLSLEKGGLRMNKKNQIFLAILLILSVAGFIANMIVGPAPRWIKAYNLLVVLAWGVWIFRTGKEKGRYW
ncbi:hypothetical protein HMPREF3213_02264 [Heyndrickxia coagulans]|uniref:Uncharacterized protein n=1 Tax=Heyndrickxia coagulans TaxID=1398 RepID=A0A133KM51_HEYCO|nr:hypothetical protein HMPREF3213_02264 [Heyndrickxia coagulans]